MDDPNEGPNEGGKGGTSLLSQINEFFGPRFDRLEEMLSRMVPRVEHDKDIRALSARVDDLERRPAQARASVNMWVGVIGVLTVVLTACVISPIASTLVSLFVYWMTHR